MSRIHSPHETRRFKRRKLAHIRGRIIEIHPQSISTVPTMSKVRSLDILVNHPVSYCVIVQCKFESLYLLVPPAICSDGRVTITAIKAQRDIGVLIQKHHYRTTKLSLV